MNNILIIIQRYNGDVMLSNALIQILYQHYNHPTIDLLVNEDTLAIGQSLPFVHKIITFSYKKKRDIGLRQDIAIIKKIYQKYDLGINLTCSDRGVIYTILSSKTSISAVGKNLLKSWWKKLFLQHYYHLDPNKHTIENNVQSLQYLNVKYDHIISSIVCKSEDRNRIIQWLSKLSIKKFVIFHPSARYTYKIYPSYLRNQLLTLLNTLGIPIIITGSNNKIDLQIKLEVPKLNNIYNMIGELTLSEYIALSSLSEAYIGMDTMNMHIASAQNKPIFVIFGPTLPKIWSPWSNKQQKYHSRKNSNGVTSYDNIHIFQSNMACVPCGNAGCNDKNSKSDCLYNIKPEVIFEEVKKHIQKSMDTLH